MKHFTFLLLLAFINLSTIFLGLQVQAEYTALTSVTDPATGEKSNASQRTPLSVSELITKVDAGEFNHFRSCQVTGGYLDNYETENDRPLDDWNPRGIYFSYGYTLTCVEKKQRNPKTYRFLFRVDITFRSEIDERETADIKNFKILKLGHSFQTQGFYPVSLINKRSYFKNRSYGFLGFYQSRKEAQEVYRDIEALRRKKLEN